MDLDTNDLISLALLLFGATLVLLGLWWTLRAPLPPMSEPTEADTSRRHVTVTRGAVFAALALAGVSVGLGVEGIEWRGMSHVEVYIPGIELPADISEPPPRTSLLYTVFWHINSEPHPPGYFVAMFGWTKVFGTSLTSLRLPSVLFGGLAVLLIFGLATRVGRSVAVGLTAAALLAFNGHHVFWTQQARMYELAMMLALASTWAWYELISSSRRKPWVEVAYLVSTLGGLYSHTLMWPILALQALFTVTRRPGPRSASSRTYVLHSLCVILGAPILAHAVYKGQDVGSGGVASLPFIQDFLTFGFLFIPDVFSGVFRDIPQSAHLPLLLVALACLAVFVTTPEFRDDVPGVQVEGPPHRGLWVLAIGMALVLFAWSREAYERQALIAAVGAVPLLTILHLVLIDRMGWLRKLQHPDRSDSWYWHPMVAVGLGSFALVFLIAQFKPVMVSRALLVSVPPLLVMLAGGLVVIFRRARWAGIVLAAVVAAAHVWSIAYFRAYPRPNDYRGVAEQMLAQLETGDLIFVPSRDWTITPLFYHLPQDHDRLVGGDYGPVAADPAVRRIWVPRVEGAEVKPEIAEALASFAKIDSVSARRTHALLYVRD